MKKVALVLLACIACQLSSTAQDVNDLIRKVKSKLDKVNDYVAEGKMKTDVAFIKAPVGRVKVFYKRPDKFTVRRDKGISILPKSGVSFNMSSVLAMENFTAIPSGESTVGGE